MQMAPNFGTDNLVYPLKDREWIQRGSGSSWNTQRHSHEEEFPTFRCPRLGRKGVKIQVVQ